MMVAVTRHQRLCAWSGVIVGGLLAAGLIVLVVAADLDTAGQAAGIVGTIVSLAGLGVSVYALRQPSPRLTAGPTVTAGASRAIAVGGDISGTASTGDSQSAQQRPGPQHAGGAPQPASPTLPGSAVAAVGERSIAAGGGISGKVSTGDTVNGANER
ncbi:hypothetical protein GCM10023080_043110 [Streptomyces pseudoechinosporeus]